VRPWGAASEHVKLSRLRIRCAVSEPKVSHSKFMRPCKPEECPMTSNANPFATFANPAVDYLTDAFQRSVLFLDVLRQRANWSRARAARRAPHVLSFNLEVVMDGRQLERPVNYGLVRIRPPEGVELDPMKRPFVVVDPRAGHGPGIGGFKAESEIGAALHAGHPCYLIGFPPEPM